MRVTTLALLAVALLYWACRSKVVLALALAAAYVEVRSRVLEAAERDGGRIGPQWLGLAAWRCLYAWSCLVGVRLASERGDIEGLDPQRRYMIAWHPHGMLAWSALFIVSRMAVVGHPHGRQWFAMVAPALFRIPLLGEALMLVNGRSVTKKVVETLASKGQSIAIQPGGITEQIQTLHDQEQAVFQRNLGFIRMAIKHGMDILPVYIFNENQLYSAAGSAQAWSQALFRRTGFGMPIFTAKFGLPMAALLPKAAGIHVRWGAPVPVGEPDPAPGEEKVEAVFAAYLLALQGLFRRYAGECLPPAVAAKGLRIIRLDGKPVPEEAGT